MLLPSCGQKPYALVGKKQPASLSPNSSNASSAKTKAQQVGLRKKIYRKLSKEGLHKKSKDMSREEAQKAKEYYEIVEDDAMMGTMLERLITIATNPQETREWILELADCYTRQGELQKAQQLYHQYTVLYPGAPDIEYVYYQEIMTNFWDIVSTDRDQHQTRTTLKLATDFLKEFPANSYTASVHDVIKTCYINLFDNELSIIHHYLAKYYYTYDPQTLVAISKRFEHILQDLIPPLLRYDKRFTLIAKAIKKVTSSTALPHETLEIPLEPMAPSAEPKLIPAEQKAERLENLLNTCAFLLHGPDPRPMSWRF
jgi:outer membrane assembly lipoprotein YfiO